MQLDSRSVRYIKVGFIVRLLLVGVLFLMPIDYRIKTILIFGTDFFDSWTTKLIAYFYNDVEDPLTLCHTFRYQIIDKSIDVFTYFLIAVYLKLSPIFFGLIFTRLIGTLLFLKTQNSQWLIAFPDVFKELLLYSWYVSELNIYNFNAIYFLKMGFEAFWHTYHNPNRYNSNH